jgi:cell fate regulator YaaT (PSP1 superfamily)
VGERRHLSFAEPELTAPPTSLPSGIPATFAGELELPEEPSFDPAGRMLYHAAAVRLEASRLVEHDGGDVSYVRGARVVCDIGHGIAWGVVVVPSRRVMLAAPPPRILRLASSGDAAAEAHIREREQTVWKIATDAARSLELGVKVVRSEAVNGGGRFVVHFASDTKVSFREWLRLIGRATRERVELQQIGMRDAARLIGGVGPCGLQLCCNTFLSDFAPVGIKMAKDQGLALNPQKVSGLCGRLLCCLVYEEANYRAGRKAMPQPGDRVDTPRGPGRVREVDVLDMRVTVGMADGEAAVFPVAEVTRRPVE